MTGTGITLSCSDRRCITVRPRRCARQPPRARPRDRRVGHGRRAHAVGLGFDHRRDPRRRLGRGLQRAHVVGDASRSTSIQHSTSQSLTTAFGHNLRPHDGYAPDRAQRAAAAQGHLRCRGIQSLVRHGHPPLRAGRLLRGGRRHDGHPAVRLQPVGAHAGRARRRFKATGHKNAYFPLFVPESFLKREAKHVEGFAPEVAWVTARGRRGAARSGWRCGRPARRIFGHFYSKWIQSWRDLPMLINQWCNVVRWEKRTVFFLRTTEFLWQEGHTAHRTRRRGARRDDAHARRLRATSPRPSWRSRSCAAKRRRPNGSPGADATYSIEALMPDGKALQSGTSHFLGQNFARAFEIAFLDQDGERNLVWTTSWGMSTRILGGMIMVHGDDGGLILPPRVAPIQVIVVPIPAAIRGRRTRGRGGGRASSISELTRPGIRVEADWSDKRPGWKFNEWELQGRAGAPRGRPARPASESGHARSPRHARAKEQIERRRRVDASPELLSTIQQGLFDRALQRSARRIPTLVDSYDEFKTVMAEQRGFLRAYWCGVGRVRERGSKRRRAPRSACIPEDAEADGHRRASAAADRRRRGRCSRSPTEADHDRCDRPNDRTGRVRAGAATSIAGRGPLPQPEVDALSVLEGERPGAASATSGRGSRRRAARAGLRALRSAADERAAAGLQRAQPARHARRRRAGCGWPASRR